MPLSYTAAARPFARVMNRTASGACPTFRSNCSNVCARCGILNVAGFGGLASGVAVVPTIPAFPNPVKHNKAMIGAAQHRKRFTGFGELTRRDDVWQKNLFVLIPAIIIPLKNVRLTASAESLTLFGRRQSL